ncbi:MAG: zinc ribbon domain-containing protein [Firmicutes bacterium]|nr:zinc ribbon domain-containing protein [Bacillota bacterium]
MFCSKCGTRLVDQAKFCHICGTSVEHKSILVAAKCTNCNANLQVDSKNEAAVCPYCGSAYIVQKAIQNFKISNYYIQPEVNSNNLVELGKTALKSGNTSEAMYYANRVLEKESRNIEAWILKILIAGSDIKNDRSSEIRAYIERILEIDESKAKEIYQAIFNVAQAHLQEAIDLLQNNMESIQKQLRDHRDRKDIAAMDSGYITQISQIFNEALEYRQIVPRIFIQTTESLRIQNEKLQKMVDQYYDALENRLRVYGAHLSERTREKKGENLDFVSGKSEISEKKSFLKRFFR